MVVYGGIIRWATKKSSTQPEVGSEIAIVDELTIRDKIHIVRGVKVMLDFDLAEIYGYTTTAFNQQVRNNAAKFEGEDFMFQLTREELNNLMSKNLTSSWGGRRKLPFCFTKSGIYMLMTVLRGDLATHQSRALIRAFRAMKDFIVENQGLLTQHDYLRLSMQMSDTQQTVHAIQAQLVEHEDRLLLTDEACTTIIDNGTTFTENEPLFSMRSL